MRLFTRVSTLALAVLVLATPMVLAQSQATTGMIEGVVRDADSAILPGVAVVIKNTATDFERTVITDSRGRFRAPLLPLGPYTVTASLDGFSTLIREGLNLAVGQTMALQFELQVSAIGEAITVTGESPLIETSRTETQIRIDDAAIEGLPNNGRNFLDFNTLTPGVTIVQGPDGDELSINGQKGINNNIMIDGADFNSPFFGEQRGGQRPAFTFNMDAVKEVLIVSEGAPAEFGRSSGGFINVVTKSGTNKLRGTAHFFYKDDSISESPQLPDGGREPDFSFDQQQYGFTLGGPLLRDKLFFFAAADIQGGDETKQTDPTRIAPDVVAFLDSVGLPNENGSIDRTNDANAYLAKLDWQVNESNLVTGRWAYHYSQQINGTFDVNSWGVSANAIETDYSHGLTATVLSTISGNLLNEFRGQYAKEWRPRSYEGQISPETGRPFPDTAFDFGGGYRVGMPFFIPVEMNEDRTQLVNNVSWLKGAHSIKGGIEYNDVTASQTFVGFANGRYIFDSFDGFQNYANNPNYVSCSDGSSSQTGQCPSGSIATGPVLLYLQQAGVGGRTVVEAGTQDIQQKELAIFVQDSWQPTANLTFDFGLRWEGLDMPDPITPPSEVFFSDFIGQTVTTAAGAQKFPSNGLIPDDKDQWQPRLAIAWTPTSKGNAVLRASSGVYHARVPALSIASPRSTNGSIGQELFRNSELGPSGIGVLPNPPAWPNIIPQEEIGDPFQPSVFVFDENFQTPRTWSNAISWEQEFIPNYAFLFKANYAKTDHITRWINRNDPVFGAPWATGLGEGGFNGLATLSTVESSAKSRYYGLTFGVNKRLSNNFQFQFYYTYSRDKSDDDNERDPFSFRYAVANNLEPEFSVSDRHQANRLNAWILYNAPWDIDINARYSYRDAQPASITETGEFANEPADRINADGSITRRNLGLKDNKFNSLDIRLAKNFNVGGFTIQPIIDIFNVFDSANFLRPGTTNLIFNFDGTVRSGGGQPRQYQLGVRFIF